MTREEAIRELKIFSGTAMIRRSANFWEALNMAIKALEQEPCEDEYIKVPKKALKYRTAGMVAYNAEWLKNHFDIERAVICGEQEPCEDCIRLEQAEVKAYFDGQSYGWDEGRKDVLDKIRAAIESHCGLIKEDHCRFCSYCNSVMGVREILEIIDRYTEESEDKE